MSLDAPVETQNLHENLKELLLAGLQPALTELFSAPELHAGPVLAEFGIRYLD